MDDPVTHVTNLALEAMRAVYPYVNGEMDGAWDDPDDLESAIRKYWASPNRLPLFTIKQDAESSQYLKPSLESTTYEVEKGDTCLHDLMAMVLCHISMAKNPAWRDISPPNEMEAINLTFFLRRAIAVSQDPTSGAFGDVGTTYQDCALVMVKYASSGQASSTFDGTPLDAYSVERHDPATYHERMREQSTTELAQIEIDDRRRARLAAEAAAFEEKVRAGADIDADDRMRRITLCHPDIFACYASRYFFEHSIYRTYAMAHTTRPIPDSVRSACVPAINRIIDEELRDFSITDRTAALVEMTSALVRLGVTSITDYIRRNGGQRSGVNVWAVYEADNEFETHRSLRTKLAETGKLFASGGNVPQHIDPAWEVVAWRRIARKLGNFDFFHHHMVFACDLPYYHDAVFTQFEDGGMLRNPYVLRYRGEWFVQAPQPGEGEKPHLYHCEMDFRLAIATWCHLVSELPDEDCVLRTGARIRPVVRVMLGLDVGDQRHVSQQERSIMEAVNGLLTHANSGGPPASTDDVTDSLNNLDLDSDGDGPLTMRDGDAEPTPSCAWLWESDDDDDDEDEDEAA